MKARWAKLAANYNALQRRERWLIAAAILGGIVLLGFSLVIDPAQKRAKLAERSVAENVAQLAAVQAQMAALQSPSQHPDVAARAELEVLKQRLAELAGRLESMERALVPPQQMAGLLEDVIGRNSGVRLVSLKTLPVLSVLEKKPAADDKNAEKPPLAATSASSAGLFRHGVEIKLEGGYQELAAYLERLEKAKLKLLWGDVALAAEKHPKLVMTLTVYTLSLDRAWLIV